MGELFPGRPPQPQTPSTRESAPGYAEFSNAVLDASFVTHTIPDISPMAGIIGLCTVPYERAGMDDLGWHIADFLAFRSLLHGETTADSQTWLAQCDISSIVEADPERYLHGRDCRVVGGAVLPLPQPGTLNNPQPPEDQIQVEPSAENLITDFLMTISKKSQIARTRGFPLVIIVCGPTSLEQDVFFGRGYRVTSTQIRHIIGDGIDTMIITPALFSAGWQVNPSFCRSPVESIRADPIEILAKQFGGIFAKDIVERFLGWSCPLLDRDRVNAYVRGDKFPGPVKPSEEQKDIIDALKTQVHGALASRLSLGHDDHSFNFNPEEDDWVKLVGPRRHKPLDHYHSKWGSLKISTIAVEDESRLRFLGTAFGGNKASQVNHIKHLVEESFQAWPRYWTLPFGRMAQEIFELFLHKPSPDDRDCHEIFNITEHRAATAILADMVVKYFGLPLPYNERCKDWDESRWINETSDDDRRATNRPYAEISRHIPHVNVPPDVNPNHLSKIQSRLEVPATYMAVSLCLRYPNRTEHLDAAVKSIVGLFNEIIDRQVELLLKDSELCQICVVWLDAIGMPIRPPGIIIGPVNLTEKPAPTVTNQQPTLRDTQPQTPITRAYTTTPVNNQPLPLLPLLPPLPPPAVVATSAVPSTPRNTTQTEQYEQQGDLSPLIREVVSRLDLEKEVRIARKERDDLMNEMANGPQPPTLEFLERFREAAKVLNFMESLVSTRNHEENADNDAGAPVHGGAAPPAPAAAPVPVVSHPDPVVDEQTGPSWSGQPTQGYTEQRRASAWSGTQYDSRL
ncbi:hypothetical protein AAE478_008643 [Parahypoxylon ruwenzoriense]